ncbi:unnamed protein product, partial [Cuscuta campestris]
MGICGGYGLENKHLKSRYLVESAKLKGK